MRVRVVVSLMAALGALLAAPPVVPASSPSVVLVDAAEVAVRPSRVRPWSVCVDGSGAAFGFTTIRPSGLDAGELQTIAAEIASFFRGWPVVVSVAEFEVCSGDDPDGRAATVFVSPGLPAPFPGSLVGVAHVGEWRDSSFDWAIASTELGVESVALIAAHELGHLVGLLHAEGSLMSAWLDPGSWWSASEAAALDAFFEAP